MRLMRVCLGNLRAKCNAPCFRVRVYRTFSAAKLLSVRPRSNSHGMGANVMGISPMQRKLPCSPVEACVHWFDSGRDFLASSSCNTRTAG